jgi:hypothetical protein
MEETRCINKSINAGSVMRVGRTKVSRDPFINGTGTLSCPLDKSFDALVITSRRRKTKSKTTAELTGLAGASDCDKSDVSKSSVAGTQNQRKRERDQYRRMRFRDSSYSFWLAVRMRIT